MLQGGAIEIDIGEGRRRRHKGHLGAGQGFAIDDGSGTDNLQVADRFAILEAHEMLVSAAPNAQVEATRQGIDDGDADAVETTRHLVGILVELSAG